MNARFDERAIREGNEPMDDHMIPVLWLCGPPGVGKTTVAWQIFSDLTQADIAAAYVDIDQLGICYPEPASDPGRHRMALRNLSAIVANFRAAGAQCVIVSGVSDPVRGVDRGLLEHTALTVCRLRADRPDLEYRFIGRGGPPHDVTEILREANDLDRSDFADHCIDTTGHAVADVTRLVREHTGWPALPDSSESGQAAETGRHHALDVDGPVLWLCGATGVGKSTVGWEVFQSVVRQGRTAAYVDLDQLGFYRPGPDAFGGDDGDHDADHADEHRVKAGNLAALWQTYRRAGADCLVVVGPAPSAAAVRTYLGALPAASVTVCRLHADRERLKDQIMQRRYGGSWAMPGDPLKGLPEERLLAVADAAIADAEALAIASIGDVRVDVDGRTVAELAEAVLARTGGWPGAAGPTTGRPARRRPVVVAPTRFH
jgi:adenylylsulfate kinase-like enzyme